MVVVPSSIHSWENIIYGQVQYVFVCSYFCCQDLIDRDIRGAENGLKQGMKDQSKKKYGP